MSAKQLLKRILWLAVVVCAPVALCTICPARDTFVLLPPAETFPLWYKVPVEIFEYSPIYATCLYASFLFSLVWWLVRFNARSSCALLLMAFVAGPSTVHIVELFKFIVLFPFARIHHFVS